MNSEVKVFADDSSLFCIVNNVNTSALTLNSDLSKIKDGTYQWKISFNSGRTIYVRRKFSPEGHVATRI